MRGKTHVISALILSLPYAINLTGLNMMLFLISIFIGSLLPDMDAKNSEIKKNRLFGNLLPLTNLVFSIILLPISFIGWKKHRGFLHSLLGAVVVCLPFIFISKIIGLGVFIGYLIHLFVDGLTKSGVPLFFPLNWRLRGFLKTGTFHEHILLFIILIMVGAVVRFDLGMIHILIILFSVNVTTYTTTKIFNI